MTAEIRFYWARLNANYWFYPALFAVLSLATFIGTVGLGDLGKVPSKAD